MARGDRREDIYYESEDREVFLKTLGQACGRTGARVHAYALMSNHYHLMLETPGPVLVDTMKWLQATYTQRFNSRHRRWGHVFGSRYKAIVIQEGVGAYFEQLADYVHLNPVRAGLVTKSDGFDSYPWTSLVEYRKTPSKRYVWLETRRLLSTFGLSDCPAGRRKFIERLETRVSWEESAAAGEVEIEGQSLQSCLRRGWYFGNQEFREKLMNSLSKPTDDYNSSARPDQTRVTAETLLDAGLWATGLKRSELEQLKKSDHRKAFVAYELATRTSVRRSWIADQLCMGMPTTVSRVIPIVRKKLADKDAEMMRYQERMARFAT